MDELKRKTSASSTYKKLAVQWLIKLCASYQFCGGRQFCAPKLPISCGCNTLATSITHSNMRYLLTILIIATCLTGFSQTQAEVNRDASESYKKIDKELNDIYKAILTEYKSDTVFIKNLKASQRIWITFRDAELKVKFPEADPRFYGSVFPMCVSIYLEKLTRERITTLKEWTEGAEEGDACNGSLKFKKN